MQTFTENFNGKGTGSIYRQGCWHLTQSLPKYCLFRQPGARITYYCAKGVFQLFSLFKLINQNQPELREYDPTTVQRIKEGAYLVKVISETEVAARKCDFYASNCENERIADFFREESKKLHNSKLILQDYYESMTRE